MKLNEVGDITINGVKAHVHELVHSILKKLERDYDLSFIKPFYKHVRIKQDKSNPNLVTITFLLPQSAKPIPRTFKFAGPGRTGDEIEKEAFERRAKTVAQELLIQLRHTVTLEDDFIEMTASGPQLFVVSDNFISADLTEAPVGILSRAATKLKKKVPFASGMRARAEGEDLANTVANLVWKDFLYWTGVTKKDPNKISPQDLHTFLSNQSYGRTGRLIIQQAEQQKKKSQEPEQAKQDSKVTPPGQDVPAGDPSKADAATKKAFQDAGLVAKESFQARLNSFLGEEVPQAELAPITFNKKEVEKIILATIAKIAEKQPDELKKRAQKNAKNKPQQDQDNKPAEEPKLDADVDAYLSMAGPALKDKFLSIFDEVIDGESLDRKAKEAIKDKVRDRLLNDEELQSQAD